MTVIASASRMPEGMNLEVRNIKFELSEQLSKDWLDNDPFKTAFFNALSMSFPAGERFFIDSVRYYHDEVKDPKLKKEMSRFLVRRACTPGSTVNTTRCCVIYAVTARKKWRAGQRSRFD